MWIKYVDENHLPAMINLDKIEDIKIRHHLGNYEILCRSPQYCEADNSFKIYASSNKEDVIKVFDALYKAIRNDCTSFTINK